MPPPDINLHYETTVNGIGINQSYGTETPEINPHLYTLLEGARNTQ